MGDISTLQKEVDRVVNLINEASVALYQPTSHVREDFERSLSRNAARIAVQLQRTVSSGKIEEALIVGAVLGVVYSGTAIFDGVKNKIAYSKARQSLSGYYQELAVKQNMLIEEQQKIIKMLSNNANELGQKESQLRERLRTLELIIDKISQAQKEKSI